KTIGRGTSRVSLVRVNVVWSQASSGRCNFADGDYCQPNHQPDSPAMGKLDKYFWTSSECGRALFIAAPFGYGTRVAAETMAGLLRLRIDRWRLNGNGTVHAKSVKLLLNFGVACPVNVSDSTYRVWIDCLMWLRQTL